MDGEYHYKLFDKMEEVCAPVIFEKKGFTNCYKILFTGSSGFLDYDTGYCCLKIASTIFPEDMNRYVTRFVVLNIDDGMLGGWGQPVDTKEDCNKKTLEVFELFKNLNILPTLRNLNELVRPLSFFIYLDG